MISIYMPWSKEKIDYYFDDSLYHTVQISQAILNRSNPFNKPFCLIVNLALGGNWGKKLTIVFCHSNS